MNHITTHPLISMRGDASVAEAARLMADSSVGALGVLDKCKRFAGIFTERDLTELVSQRKDLDELTVGAAANDLPLVVDGPLTEDEAKERMARARVRHLIVRENGDMRMFSMRDLFHPSDSAAPPDRRRSSRARDVMSSPVIAARLEAFFEEIAETLAGHNISGMPVVDAHGYAVGMVSERDLAHVLGGPLVRMAIRRHRRSRTPNIQALTELPRSARRARDVMSTPLVSVGSDTPIEEIARLMVVHEINRVPVLEGKRLMGIVSRGDVLQTIGRLRRRDRPAIEHQPIIVGGASPMLSYDLTDPDLIDLTTS
ncbi:MAG: CBS domain-containing protein [Actinomycetota bacterium]